jgi:two-component system, response regulator YesN
MTTLKDYYIKAVFILMEYLNYHNIEIPDIFGSEISFYSEINSFETLNELSVWIRNKVKKIFEYLFNTKMHIYSRAVYKSVKYIKQNYSDKKLCLKILSDFTGLNRSHLSFMFSKEVGISFKDYLIKYRINRAKEYLRNTNYKIYEICEKVGYGNVEHFSRIFKKITGFSPKKFK